MSAMIVGRPGLDVSTLAKNVLARDAHAYRVELRNAITSGVLPTSRMDVDAQINPYARLFNTEAGSAVHQVLGNESKSLDVVSAIGIELLFETLRERAVLPEGRCIAVPGMPHETPALVVLDPRLSNVSQSKRVSQTGAVDPHGIMAAFNRLRPVLHEVVGYEAANAVASLRAESAVELFWISQPAVVVTSRPKMEFLCAPSPCVPIQCANKTSSVGILCKDADGHMGVTGCFHGTGPVGTKVRIGSTPGKVKLASELQDIVFIPISLGEPKPGLYGTKGIRGKPAPSEAEPVNFDGAGTMRKTPTHVMSHDAGILRIMSTLQLKVQTPGDTNNGDSGSALVDENDQVIAFGFMRSSNDEYPQLTDWIWASNALSALNLTPV